MSEGMNYTIYIDGQPHRCTNPFVGCFYADHPSLPGRYCSQHNIGVEAGVWLKTNHAVITSGHRYSMHAPAKPKPMPVVEAIEEAPSHRYSADRAVFIACFIAAVSILLDLYIWRP